MSQASYNHIRELADDPLIRRLANTTSCTDCGDVLRQPCIAAYKDCGPAYLWAPPYQPQFLLPRFCVLEEGRLLRFWCGRCAQDYPTTYYDWVRPSPQLQEEARIVGEEPDSEREPVPTETDAATSEPIYVEDEQ